MQIMAEKLGFRIPQQEILNEELSLKIFEYVESHYLIDSNTKSIFARAETDLRDNKKPLRISITEWIPYQLGFDWLAKRDFSSTNLIDQQLADMWVALAVLGVRDFHYKNWLTDGTSVWPLDFAIKYSATDVNGTIMSSERQGPLQGWNLDAMEIVLFSRMASPEIIKKLQKLTDEELKTIAKNSGYELQDSELADYRSILKSVLDLRK